MYFVSILLIGIQKSQTTSIYIKYNDYNITVGLTIVLFLLLCTQSSLTQVYIGFMLVSCVK